MQNIRCAGKDIGRGVIRVQVCFAEKWTFPDFQG